MCELVARFGRQGLLIGEASEKLGITSATFARYERQYPRFREAAAGVRLNSQKHLDQRWISLLGKDEAQLLKALEHVRRRRADAVKRVQAKYGTTQSV